MWCPACGTEMILPESICPACHKQVPLGDGDFLTGFSVPAEPPKESPRTADTSFCPDKPGSKSEPEPEPEPISPNPLGFFKQCHAEFKGLMQRFSRKDDITP